MDKMITALTLAPVVAAVLILALPERRARAVAMAGALAAERSGELSTLGSGLRRVGGARVQAAVQAFAKGSTALVCGLLALAVILYSEKGRLFGRRVANA